MKKIILAGLMAILPFGSAVAATDYYIKLGGVEGEASRSAVPGVSAPAPQEASVDAFIKIEGVEGEAAHTTSLQTGVYKDVLC